MSEIQMERMSNITRDNNNRLPTMEQKLNQFWNFYSKFLIQFAWLILILSFLCTLGLSMAFFYLMQIRQFDQTDFLVSNGQALKNIQRIESIFGNDKGYRVHQQMDLYPALDVIIKRKILVNHPDLNATNLLNNQIIDEVHSLDQQIQSIRVNNNDSTKQYNYSLLCEIINHACVVDGNYLLSNKFRQDALNLKYIPSGIYFDSLTGANGIASFIFGKDYRVTNITPTSDDYDDDDEEEEDAPVVTTEIVSHVPIFRLRYSLNVSNDEMRALSIQWEREVLRYLNDKFQSNFITVLPSTSLSINDAISKQAHHEGPFMAVMLLIFFIFVCVSISIQGNSHTSVGYLSLGGILSLMLSTGATFGLLSIFRIQIIEPMALIVLVVAIIDCMRMSIVCGEYHRIIKEHLSTPTTRNVATKIDIERILPAMIKSTRPYFLCSLVILILVYLIMSLLSPMSCIKSMGLTLIFYLCVNYFTHCTFFSSCLIITLKRVASRRHSLFCYHLSNDYYSKNRIKSILQRPKKYFSNCDPIFKKAASGVSGFLSLVFVIVSVWLILSIDTRLFDDQFLPKNATLLRSYMRSQMADYELGPVIMFVIPQAIDYENKNNQYHIRRIMNQCLNETTTSEFKLLWLEQENIKTILTSKDPISLRITPYSQNDLIIGQEKNRSIITASRFYCQYKSIRGDRDALRVMNNMYRYAQESSIPSIFPFSIIFSHYESLAQIRMEMYILILVMIISTFVITLLMFFSFEKTLFVFIHWLMLLTGSLACLYLFHHLSFNFANALWLYIVPVVFLETIIHACFNTQESKWKYNRIILSLIVSLVISLFFPIETYIFLTIRNSLMYQSILCLIIINWILPSWNYIMKTYFKKNQKEKIPITTIVETNQSPTTAGTEIQNLVHEPNGSI